MVIPKLACVKDRNRGALTDLRAHLSRSMSRVESFGAKNAGRKMLGNDMPCAAWDLVGDLDHR
eukprot:3983549-Pyramimonas_sp.AAC.1